MRRCYLLNFAFCGALLPILLGGCGGPIAAQTVGRPTATKAAVDRVTAGLPKRTHLKVTTAQPARIASFEEAPLLPKISGYVQEVLVDIGDTVTAGQPLVHLSVPELLDEVEQKQALVAQSEAELKQAEAGVDAAGAAAESAQAQVAQAVAGVERAEGNIQRWEAEYARIKELAAKDSVTKKLVDETLNQLRAAEAARRESLANVEAVKAEQKQAQVSIRRAHVDQLTAAAKLRVAKANLAHTNTMLEYTHIKAPFAGMITHRSIDRGHYVVPGSGSSARPLLVVSRMDLVRVSVDVPEMDAPLANRGDQATIRVQSLGGREFNAPIARTSWSLEPSNRSLRVEVDVPNPDGTLRPGMYAMATILLDQRDKALTLPVAAIIRDGGKVYCASVRSGRIDRQLIELGLRSGDEVEVVSGLQDGQLVVLARAEGLQAGQAVEVIEAPK